MTRLTINHARQRGLCVSGMRRICEQHGYDFRRFVKEGIPVDEIRHIQDAEVQRMIEVAERSEKNGR